jgi:hypothetical protein
MTSNRKLNDCECACMLGLFLVPRQPPMIIVMIMEIRLMLS